MNSIERFEIIGWLYYGATGKLRPGKDDPIEESSSEENIERFEQWFATKSFTDALEAIRDRDLIIEAVSKIADVEEIPLYKHTEEQITTANNALLAIREMIPQ